MIKLDRKNNKILGILFVVALSIAISPLRGNGFQAQGISPETSEVQTFKIAVSILPQTEWIKKIGGDRIEVQELIPSGASPATHQPTATQLTFVSEADIWFQIGLIEFDRANEDAIIGNAPNTMQVVNLSVGLELVHMRSHTHEEEGTDGESTSDSHSEAAIDPHVWTSPTNVIQMAKEINQTLADLDPTYADYYSSNTDDYISDLEDLNASISKYMKDVQNRHMLVFHPSWGYFAHEYNIDMIALEEEGKDPSSEHFQEVIDLARENEVGAIFTQAQFSKEQAKAFSEEVCVEIVEIDPLAPNYIENMNSTAQLIAQKLDQDTFCTAGIPGFPPYAFAVGIFIGLLGMFCRIYKNSRRQKM